MATIGGGMIAIIIGVILAILPFIISLLMSASMTTLWFFMDARLLNMSSSGNLLQVIDDIFGSGGFLATFMKDSGGNPINIAQFVMQLAIYLIIFIMFVELLNSYLQSLQGEQSEHPLKIILRACITILLEFFLFGNPFNTTGTTFLVHKGFLWELGNIFPQFINSIGNFGDGQVLEATASAYNFSVDLLLPNQIVIIIMSFALFKGVVEAGIIFVERWLTFAISVFFSPLAIALNTSKKTSRSASECLFSLLTQLITIMLSIIVFRMLVGSLKGLENFNSLQGNFMPNLVFQYAISISLLALMKNSEKFLNAWGIKTIANGDSLKEFSKGASAFSNMIGAVTTGAKRQLSGQLYSSYTHGRAKHYTDKYGANSWRSRLFSTLDTKDKPKPSKINNPVARGFEYGRFKMPTGDIPKGVVTATNNVNSALKKGLGTSVNMQDVMKATGMSQIDGMKVSSVGKIGQVNSNDGNSPRSAILFKGTTKGEGGQSFDKNYAMVLGGSNNTLGQFDTINASDKIKLTGDSKSENTTIDLGNNTGFIQEVSYKMPKIMSANEFNASPEAEQSTYANYKENQNQKKLSIEEYDRDFDNESYIDTYDVNFYEPKESPKDKDNPNDNSDVDNQAKSLDEDTYRNAFNFEVDNKDNINE